MLYTENLNLKKPQPEDYAKIADLNENADAIDAAIANLLNKINSLDYTVISGSFSATFPASTTISTTIELGKKPKFVIIYNYENNNREYVSVGTSEGRLSDIPVILSSTLVDGSKSRITDTGFVHVGANSLGSSITHTFAYLAFL